MANKLIGKTIAEMKIAEDKRAILFVTDGGDIVAKVDGDCCSSTWVEGIVLPALGFPAKVMSIEDLDMPDQPQTDEYDVVKFYGCKINTDKGEIVIDYRNSSNGYSGGNIWFPSDNEDEYNHFYGGVYGQNVSEEKWTNIKEN